MDSSIVPQVPTMVSDHIHAAINRRPYHQVGPFRVALDQHSAELGRNYAVPDDGAQPTRQDVDALIALFEREQRLPRLEYIARSAPAVEAALTAAGFTVEGRPPILVSTPGQPLHPRVPEAIVIDLATTDDQLFAAATVQDAAYLAPGPTGPHELARLRATVARGGLVAVAHDTVSGAAVGAGLVDRTGPLDALGELAAVGTLEPFRRRGIASALSVHLARAAHDRGVQLVWLEAAPGEERIYAMAGFQPAAWKLLISRAAAAS